MSLVGRRVIVTSGATVEVTSLDRVRVATMTNRSAGTFGALVGALLLAAEADVSYLHGRGARLPTEAGILESIGLAPGDLRGRLDLDEFGGIEDLIAALERRLVGASVLATLMIVAGSDYRFGEVLRDGLAVKTGKVGSGADDLVVSLAPTRKAIAEVKRFNPGALLVGTKLETDVDVDELARRAHARLAACGADLFVADTDEALRRPDSEHLFVFPDGAYCRHKGKLAAARALVAWLEERAESRLPGGSGTKGG